MALTKRTYVPHETTIISSNLNAIQDEIISEADSIGVLDASVVKTVAQSLTTDKKAQARSNIGVGNVGTLTYTVVSTW